MNRDYHLSFGSPAFNTGDPNTTLQVGETDNDGEDRILYDPIDMGADEFKAPFNFGVIPGGN